MIYIILIVSFLLDGILSNFLAYMINDCSVLMPLFTLVSIILIYPFYQKKVKNYFVLSVVIGILYDLFYTNLFLTNAILYFMMVFFICHVYSKLNINWLTNLFLIMIGIIFYECLYAFLLFLFNIVPIDFFTLCYQIAHSLLLNVIYGEILYLLCQLLPKKRRLN